MERLDFPRFFTEAAAAIFPFLYHKTFKVHMRRNNYWNNNESIQSRQKEKKVCTLEWKAGAEAALCISRLRYALIHCTRDTKNLGWCDIFFERRNEK